MSKEWITHDGRLMPVHGETFVIPKLRNGETRAPAPAASFCWTWGPSERAHFDIIEYCALSAQQSEEHPRGD